MLKTIFLILPLLSYAEIPNKLYRDCSSGVYRSCYDIGISRISISSPDYDVNLGLEYLNTSCNGSYAPACLKLGHYYSSQHDKKNSSFFFQRACELKSSMGCVYYNKGL